MPEMPLIGRPGLQGHTDPFRLYGSHTFQLIHRPDSAMGGTERRFVRNVPQCRHSNVRLEYGKFCRRMKCRKLVCKERFCVKIAGVKMGKTPSNPSTPNTTAQGTLIKPLQSSLQIWVQSVSNIRIHTEDTQLFLRSKYLIIRSKCFH